LDVVHVPAVGRHRQIVGVEDRNLNAANLKLGPPDIT
jgi:hypothetical protein